VRLKWVNTLRRMLGRSEVSEMDLSEYLQVAARYGLPEEAGEQAMVLDQSPANLDELGRYMEAWGLTNRSGLIKVMFDNEISSEAIVEALKGTPEYRAPFPNLPD
jgi:hypothetical protein